MFAEKTLNKINEYLERDQGATYKALLKSCMMELEDAYDGSEVNFRTHLGASVVGQDCYRKIWFGYRWAKKPSFDGKTLRLFNLGHLSEGTMVALFKLIGCTIYQIMPSGKQYGFKEHHGHFSGSVDCVIQGLPEYPKACLGEFKTHGEKSFNKLCVEGVERSKPEHFTQMQIYMHYMKLKKGLYCAYNKNTSDIWLEYIDYNNELALMAIEKARQIIFENRNGKISNSASWYKCKFCDYTNICHNDKLEEIEKNCRTCKNVVVKDIGWYCKKHNSLLSKEDQLKGCEHWNLNEAFK